MKRHSSSRRSAFLRHYAAQVHTEVFRRYVVVSRVPFPTPVLFLTPTPASARSVSLRRVMEDLQLLELPDGGTARHARRAGSPLLSVIVPVRNDPAHLRRCLLSLQASTAVDFEILIVDDHSEDETLAVARRFAENNGVKEIYIPTNGFSRTALNVNSAPFSNRSRRGWWHASCRSSACRRTTTASGAMRVRSRGRWKRTTCSPTCSRPTRGCESMRSARRPARTSANFGN